MLLPLRNGAGDSNDRDVDDSTDVDEADGGDCSTWNGDGESGTATGLTWPTSMAEWRRDRGGMAETTAVTVSLACV